jgi:molybdenum cofactor cytidylyltransferase
LLSKNSIACVVLAAGSSVRFGGAKQLAELNGKPLVKSAVDAANESVADYVLLVVGNHSSEILEKVQLGRAQMVYNREFETGISSSIRCGIANVPDDCSGAIIMVADQPFLESKHLDLMISEFRNDPTKIIVLAHKSEPRNPVLIPKAMFPDLEKLKNDVGAKDIVRKSRNIKMLEILDSKVFLDVDTKDSLLELRTESEN